MYCGVALSFYPISVLRCETLYGTPCSVSERAWSKNLCRSAKALDHATASSSAWAQKQTASHVRQPAHTSSAPAPRSSRNPPPAPWRSETQSPTSCISNIIHLDKSHARTHRLGMPPSTSQLKPTQMPAPTRRTQNHPRILPDLLIRHRFIKRNRIIPRMQHQRWDPYRQDRIRTTSIAIIRALARIPPRRTLILSIKLMQILRLLNPVLGDILIGEEFGAVGLKQSAHRGTHGFAVDFAADPCMQEEGGGDFEAPGVGDDDGGVERAFVTFFGNVLE